MSAEETNPVGETEQEAWTERIPCPDESCIGTMGGDGHCRVCGRAGETPAIQTARPESADTATKEAEAPDDPELTPENQGDPEPPGLETGDGERESETDDRWEARKLCPDDSCIGTLGTDGRCRVCGLEGSLD